ncbi:MAG: hypothetical protein MZW92_59060 [Comamonadaceae bacterium]|nr:hypothetical protein [Comamonadaceae bacterium]
MAQAIRASVPRAPSMRAIDLGAGRGCWLVLAADVGEMVLAEPSAGSARRGLARSWPPDRLRTSARSTSRCQPTRRPAGRSTWRSRCWSCITSGTRRRRCAPSIACWARTAASPWPTSTPRTARSTARRPRGVYHHGFDRAELVRLAGEAGFVDVEVRTATEIPGEGRTYPIFLLLGRRP